jgi:hypothetical protein
MAWSVTKKVKSMATWYFQFDRFRKLKIVITKGHICITVYCGKILRTIDVGAVLLQDILMKYPFMIRRLVCH